MLLDLCRIVALVSRGQFSRGARKGAPKPVNESVLRQALSRRQILPLMPLRRTPLRRQKDDGHNGNHRRRKQPYDNPSAHQSSLVFAIQLMKPDTVMVVSVSSIRIALPFLGRIASAPVTL